MTKIPRYTTVYHEQSENAKSEKVQVHLPRLHLLLCQRTLSFISENKI